MLLNAGYQPGAIGIIVYVLVVLIVAVPIVIGVVKLYKLCIKALKKYVGEEKEKVD